MPMISKLAANKLLDEAGFGIPDVCAVCRKMGEMKKCGRCTQAYYCSAECQVRAVEQGARGQITSRQK